MFPNTLSFRSIYIALIKKRVGGGEARWNIVTENFHFSFDRVITRFVENVIFFQDDRPGWPGSSRRSRIGRKRGKTSLLSTETTLIGRIAVIGIGRATRNEFAVWDSPALAGSMKPLKIWSSGLLAALFNSAAFTGENGTLVRRLSAGQNVIPWPSNSRSQKLPGMTSGHSEVDSGMKLKKKKKKRADKKNEIKRKSEKRDQFHS